MKEWFKMRKNAILKLTEEENIGKEAKKILVKYFFKEDKQNFRGGSLEEISKHLYSFEVNVPKRRRRHEYFLSS